jgi:hypothetical protein
MDQFKNLILRFSQFINESDSYGFEIDQRFPWTDKINDLVDQIMSKKRYLTGNFEYDRHNGNGFEFNIKSRAFPDTEDLSKKYGYSEDELNYMWDSFLSDNLQMSGDDIIENSENFDDWFTTGRSGGWLILKHKSNLITDPESVIEDNLSYLNDLTDEIDEEEYQEWKKFYEDDVETKRGSNLLKSFEIEVGDFENVKSAEDESKVAIASLEENLKELQNLEKDLDEVQKRIDTFWEDAEVNFEEYVENESKWRDSNQL